MTIKCWRQSSLLPCYETELSVRSCIEARGKFREAEVLELKKDRSFEHGEGDPRVREPLKHVDMLTSTVRPSLGIPTSNRDSSSHLRESWHSLSHQSWYVTVDIEELVSTQ